MLNIWPNMKNILKPVISRTGMIKAFDMYVSVYPSPFIIIMAITLLPIHLSKIIIF